MTVIATIECRMGSTRLPGKVLLKFGELTVMEYMVRRVRYAKCVDEVVIATTNSPQDDEIVKVCQENNIRYFRGSEINVIKRVVETGHAFGAEALVVLSGDCPFVCPKMIDGLFTQFKSGDYDYVSNDVIERFFPDGLDIQICKTSVLGRTISMITDYNHFSHSAWNIPVYVKDAKVLHWKGPQEYYMPEIGLTLDTQDDYSLLKRIHDGFSTSDTPFDIYKVLDYIRENPNFVTNGHVKRKVPGSGE